MALSIPDFEAYLASLGVGAANDSGSRYITDGQGEQQRLSQGMLDEMMGNDLTGYQQAQITQQGYVPLEPLNDVSWMNQNYGTNFQSGADYAKYLYGDGTVETGPDGKQYFKTPNGTTAYVNQPLKYIAPDDKLGGLVKMGILGLATAGLGGYLPGTESIFGGAAAGAGAGAGAVKGAAEGALALGAEAPWWSSLPTFGDPLTAAGVAGGATSTGSSLAALGGAGMGLTGGAGLGAIPTIAGGAGAGSGFSLTDFLTQGLSQGAQSAGSSLLQNVLGGPGETDWTQILGALGTAGIGAYAGGQQADSYNQLAQQYLGMGQPYRDKLAATYDPNWSFADTPDMQRSSQAAMDQASRALSAKFGNPADSSTAIGELLKYGIDNNLSKSFDYRNQLGQFGGLGSAPVQAGAQSGLMGVKAQGGIYEALGSGFENLTNPFKLNNGFSF